MNKENIRKWVKALRSGKYEQTQGALRVRGASGASFCCLGVACEVYQKETGEGEWDDSYFRSEGGLAAGHLADSVVEWLGLDQTNPRFLYPKSASGTSQATVLNDKFQLSFEEIADAIEATYLREEAPCERQ